MSDITFEVGQRVRSIFYDENVVISEIRGKDGNGDVWYEVEFDEPVSEHQVRHIQGLLEPLFCPLCKSEYVYSDYQEKWLCPRCEL